MLETHISKVDTPQIFTPENKDKTYRLIWIGDISTTPSANLYRALFQDTATKRYYPLDIYPESLSYYTIGYHYRDNMIAKRVGKIYSISIESTEDNQIRTISGVLRDGEYSLKHVSHEEGEKEVSFAQENKRQYCVVFENEKQIIVFPCVVLGATYYFTSSSMRQQIFAHNLKGLYEDIEIDRNTGEATIVLKTLARSEDAQHIVRFAKNEFAQKQWNAIRFSLLKEQQVRTQLEGTAISVPLAIDFPVKQTIKMDVRAFRYLDYKGTKKEKLLVLKIIKEDSNYDFTKLIRKRRGRKGIPVEVKLPVHVESHETTSKLKNKVPSSNLAPIAIVNAHEEQSVNIQKIETKDELIQNGEPPNIFTVSGGDGEPVDISIREPNKNGDFTTRPGIIEIRGSSAQNKADEWGGQESGAREEEQEEESEGYSKESYNLADFLKLIENFKALQRANSIIVREPRYVPLRNKRSKVYSLRETYDSNIEKRRRYLQVTFKYAGVSACLIEIDQDHLPYGCATYFLLAEGGYIFNQGDVDRVLKSFVEYKKIADITDEMKIRRLRFLSKKHPAEKNEESFKRWAAGLLSLISYGAA